jgi:alpha-ribazole phosphatase
VILLRHSRPEVAEATCYGRTDLRLAPDFEEAAAAVLAGLPPVAAVRSSPLVRCLRLAERIAGACGLALEVDPLLVEMDFGRWETRAWSEIARAELDAWAADFDHARPHGGESVAMLAARVGKALAATEQGEPPVLWVTHSGVIRAACALTGRAPGWDTNVAFGCWLDLREPGAHTEGRQAGMPQEG